MQGYSVAISADGNTAIVGGPGDNSEAGAAWVFTRSGDVWSQQGNKLVGWDALEQSGQGTSVAISGDGNTAIVGGPGDSSGLCFNEEAGASWVYTRSGGVWTQQGSKLLGTGAFTYHGDLGAEQGLSVAISADGDTAIIGGPYDERDPPLEPVGAAWVFTRSVGVWTQQGSKLVGSGAVGNAGWSVAISANGNTAVVGAPADNSNAGAAWVYTRSAGVWTQQGPKLVGSDAVGPASQGTSVAISGDGNTAIVGGPGDNSNAGAVWVYTRSGGGVWFQQGSKLFGMDAAWPSQQGTSVAISEDGNTAIVGGPYDNSNCGAAWVYTRGAGVWTQQGAKLVGAVAVGLAYQGDSVAISADGNTAIVGGLDDNSGAGAAWVYTRSGGVWSQQGTKLVGAGAVGLAYQGGSVAISADGRTAIVGGSGDNSSSGAAWVFVAGGCTSPSITLQPQSTTISSGQTATLFVTATGTTPSPTSGTWDPAATPRSRWGPA